MNSLEVGQKYHENLQKSLEALTGEYYIISSSRTLFKTGDRVEILDTGANRSRHKKTIGMKGLVLYPYYTVNRLGDSQEYKNYAVRVMLEDGRYLSYMTTDLKKINK